MVLLMQEYTPAITVFYSVFQTSWQCLNNQWLPIKSFTDEELNLFYAVIIISFCSRVLHLFLRKITLSVLHGMNSRNLVNTRKVRKLHAFSKMYIIHIFLFVANCIHVYNKKNNKGLYSIFFCIHFSFVPVKRNIQEHDFYNLKNMC